MVLWGVGGWFGFQACGACLLAASSDGQVLRAGRLSKDGKEILMCWMSLALARVS